MLQHILFYCIKRANVSIYVLSLFYCFILLLFPDNLQLGLGITAVYIVVLYVLTRNLLTSFMIGFLISSQFFTPAKEYQFEYASAREYISELRPRGIMSSISLNLSDITGMFIVFLLIKNKILFIINKKAFGTNRQFISLLQAPSTLWVLLCWLMYFLLSLYSSIYLSFSPLYSLNLLAQYAKMVIAFIAILYLNIEQTSKRPLMYIVLLVMLSFQSVVGISQFAISLSNYGLTEKLVTADIEQNVVLSRVIGIYGSANAHAYSIAVLLLLCLPFLINNNKWVLSAIGSLAAVNIILSQSRTVWVGFFVLLLLYIKKVYKYMKSVLRVYAIWILIAFFFIMYPRIEASNVFFTEEGGGHLRLEMLADGAQLLKESPWIGYGAGTGIRVFLNKLPNGYIHTFPDEIHNIFFQIAIESGIPAAILFFTPFVVFLWIWFLKSHTKLMERYSFAGALNSVIIAFIHYLAQPAYGRRDFVILGIILGVGIGAINNLDRIKHE